LGKILIFIHGFALLFNLCFELGNGFDRVA
jgi:hypothetical protein